MTVHSRRMERQPASVEMSICIQYTVQRSVALCGRWRRHSRKSCRFNRRRSCKNDMHTPLPHRELILSIRTRESNSRRRLLMRRDRCISFIWGCPSLRRPASATAPLEKLQACSSSSRDSFANASRWCRRRGAVGRRAGAALVLWCTRTGRDRPIHCGWDAIRIGDFVPPSCGARNPRFATRPVGARGAIFGVCASGRKHQGAGDQYALANRKDGKLHVEFSLSRFGRHHSDRPCSER